MMERLQEDSDRGIPHELPQASCRGRAVPQEALTLPPSCPGKS